MHTTTYHCEQTHKYGMQDGPYFTIKVIQQGGVGRFYLPPLFAPVYAKLLPKFSASLTVH